MPNQHLIYTGSRSGSNFLVNILNQHPNIVNYGEVVGQWTVPRKLYQIFRRDEKISLGYLNFIYEGKSFFYTAQLYSTIERIKRRQKPNFKYLKNVKTLGIKEFHYHFNENRDLRDFVLNNKQIKVIHLYRTNILKKHISLQRLSTLSVVANVDGSDQSTIREYRSRKITLSIDNILKTLKRGEEMLEERYALMNSLPKDNVFSVSYESLFASEASQKKYISEIFDFLKVKDFQYQSKHRKLSADSIQDLVENYEELQHSLSGTRYEKYLNS